MSSVVTLVILTPGSVEWSPGAWVALIAQGRAELLSLSTKEQKLQWPQGTDKKAAPVSWLFGFEGTSWVGLPENHKVPLVQ